MNNEKKTQNKKQLTKILPLWIVHHFNEYSTQNESTQNDAKKTIHTLSKHTSFLWKLLTANNLINDILIYHDVGTGKTMEA